MTQEEALSLHSFADGLFDALFIHEAGSYPTASSTADGQRMEEHTRPPELASKHAVNLSSIPGVAHASGQIIRGKKLRVLHQRKHRPTELYPAMSPFQPSMAVDQRLEIRRIDDTTHPCFGERNGGFGLFCKHAVAIVPKGTVLGEYAGEVRTEFNRSRLVQMGFETASNRSNPASTFASETRTDMRDDNYALALSFTHDDEWLDFSFDPPMATDEQLLHIDARIHRNELAFINDPRPARAANAEFEELLVRGWPHVFVVAAADIRPNDEVLIDYGNNFWECNAEQVEYCNNNLQCLHNHQTE